MGVNLPPSGIAISGVVPLFFFKATSEIRAFFVVLSRLDPRAWSKLEKQDGRQESPFPKIHIFLKKTEVRHAINTIPVWLG